MHLKRILNTVLIFIVGGFITIISQAQLTAQKKSLKQITFSDSTHDGYPYWSPDGKFIIYSSGIKNTCKTKIVPAEGGPSKEITSYFSQHSRFSPDGKYIVFDGEQGTKIQISTPYGGTPIRIVPEKIPIYNSGMPIWSPDGKKIAFKSIGKIYTMELETGILSKIFQMDNKNTIPFDWTSDSKNLIIDLSDSSTRKSDIWLISVEEKAGKQITFMEGDDSNPQFDVEASWSPDGTKIAFSSTRTGYWAIWIMELDLDYIKSKLKLNNK